MDILLIVAAAVLFGLAGLMVGQRIGHERGERETLLATAEKLRQLNAVHAKQLRAAETATSDAVRSGKSNQEQVRKLERKIDGLKGDVRRAEEEMTAARREHLALLTLADSVVSTGSRSAMVKLQQAVVVAEEEAEKRPPAKRAPPMARRKEAVDEAGVSPDAESDGSRPKPE